MEIQGKIAKCPNCSGRGTCDCRGCNLSVGSTGSVTRYVVCSACQGKGEVWIGPPVQPNEVHHHTHTHEAGRIDDLLLERLLGDLDKSIDRFGMAMEQQSTILLRMASMIEQPRQEYQDITESD